MKIHFSGTRGILLACAAALLLSTTSPATIIVRDTFEYPSGNLAGNNGGFSLDANNQWSGAWATLGVSSLATDFQVSGAQVITPNDKEDPGFVARPFSQNQGASTYYFGYDFYLPDGAENVMYAGAGLLDSSLLAPGKHGGLYSWIYTQQDGGQLKLRGLLGAADSVGGSTALVPGTQYRIVGRLQWNGGGADEVLTVWLFPSGSPTTESATPEFSNQYDLGNGMGAGRAFLYRESINSTEVRFGDFRLTTDFISAVPEPGAAALIGIGLTILLRRRR